VQPLNAEMVHTVSAKAGAARAPTMAVLPNGFDEVNLRKKG
jgi:hypothetical protein